MQYQNHTPEPRAAVDGHLTLREREVLHLVARGFSNAAIGFHLSISVRTVETHLTAVFGKLVVKNRLQAVIIGLHDGLLDITDLVVDPDAEVEGETVSFFSEAQDCDRKERG